VAGRKKEGEGGTKESKTCQPSNAAPTTILPHHLRLFSPPPIQSFPTNSMENPRALPVSFVHSQTSFDKEKLKKLLSA
jgi:hypothetical protein